MKWFLSLSTGAKLLLGFGLMMILLATVMVTAYSGIRSIQESERTLFEKDFVSTVSLVSYRSRWKVTSKPRGPCEPARWE